MKNDLEKKERTARACRQEEGGGREIGSLDRTGEARL